MPQSDHLQTDSCFPWAHISILQVMSLSFPLVVVTSSESPACHLRSTSSLYADRLSPPLPLTAPAFPTVILYKRLFLGEEQRTLQPGERILPTSFSSVKKPGEGQKSEGA